MAVAALSGLLRVPWVSAAELPQIESDGAGRLAITAADIIMKTESGEVTVADLMAAVADVAQLKIDAAAANHAAEIAELKRSTTRELLALKLQVEAQTARAETAADERAVMASKLKLLRAHAEQVGQQRQPPPAACSLPPLPAKRLVFRGFIFPEISFFWCSRVASHGRTES